MLANPPKLANPSNISLAAGHEEVVKARQEVVAAMLANPPKLFKPRVKAAVVS